MSTRPAPPPMPSEVKSASAVPGCSSDLMPMNLATILGSGMRMRGGMLRSQQNHEFTARTADVARADGKNSVPGSRLLQQVLDAFLHGAKIVDVLVARLANGAHQRFTTDADRKSTRLNSSHSQISYAVFCLKKNRIAQYLGMRDLLRN